MKRQVFSYCIKTETIRTMPTNYLVAYKRDGRWICEPDLACPIKMAIRCFKALRKFDNVYGTGLHLLAAITPYKAIE